MLWVCLVIFVFGFLSLDWFVVYCWLWLFVGYFSGLLHVTLCLVLFTFGVDWFVVLC